MTRFWLLPQGVQGRDSVILTGDEMQREGVHPLRCVYLGRFDDVRRAKAKAIELRAFDEPPELVIASNIRIACDRRQTTRWRLSEQEIDLLRRGEHLTVRDKLGRFTLAAARGEQPRGWPLESAPTPIRS
jgi:hypothetical protein